MGSAGAGEQFGEISKRGTNLRREKRDWKPEQTNGNDSCVGYIAILGSGKKNLN